MLSAPFNRGPFGPPGATAPQASPPKLQPVDLHLHFAIADAPPRYLAALASLLSATATASATLATGAQRVDLDPKDLADLLRRSAIQTLRLTLPLGAQRTTLDVSLTTDTVTLSLPVTPLPSTARLWLQADPDLPSPRRTLALPASADALTLESLHALVGLALDLGLTRATAPQLGLSWSTTPTEQAAPLYTTPLGDPWTPALDPSPPRAWVTGLPTPSQPSSLFWDRLGSLIRSPHDHLADLHAHLSSAIPITFEWTLSVLDDAPPHFFNVAPEALTVSRLIPEPTRVVVALDFTQRPETLTDLLLHACAHLVLAHVRPGDAAGHWDTATSLSSPHRHWDREAQAYLDTHLPRPNRRVTSLAECNPRDKAWLVLFDHIGRMVGESRTLHEAAERYQAAAYQRQAAQRLVAQLEEYSGAMLCDGVGLGKTYVATTVLVHYANAWRDQHAAQDQSTTDDPLRVTILSPNAVVSTWQREALPPLAAHGVQLANVRVLSHTKLSRIVASSDILARARGGLSDMEHLLLSDLVIVDEAHNFRSVGARRTAILRDILRLQPRRGLRRKVLLLTATPVNNSLEDLRQQAALMISKPLWLNDLTAPDTYRARALKDIDERMAKATRAKSSDVTAQLIHGDPNATFSNTLHFRDDIQFGVQVPRVGDYLKEQEKKLAAQQALVRAAIQTGAPPREGITRIAADLLDRIVVQRSRALCKQIELEYGSSSRLLFRPDAAAPEKLIYEDVYDDTRDVLARFLPLFETPTSSRPSAAPALSLKVHMWADVRDGLRDASQVTSVVGLQRVLVLKRLESSPVAFLITLLRLLAQHASRLGELADLCRDLADKTRAQTLLHDLGRLLDDLPTVERARLDLLMTGGRTGPTSGDLLVAWREAHLGAKAAADCEDPLPPQLDLVDREDDKTTKRREQLDRLSALREDLSRDLAILLRTAPGLADIIFGRFAEADWPRRFIRGGLDVDWPRSAAWGMRIVNDAKLRRLVARLLRARADQQKVIVFSQFTDTLAYIDSVLRAALALDRHEWNTVLRELTAAAGLTISKDDVARLVSRSAVVSGDTEDRDAVINTFCPFYRLGPHRPVTGSDPSGAALEDLWRAGWTEALSTPIDILFATDVLAEGVNLQDAALLINFDVHWNPVRMIQRAGRIDRRLNPAIEDAKAFPDLDALARALGVAPPLYWWHAHPDAAPVTANLLLPDELEAELQLRERIANKTLAIDFTLGLDQGTGAEADWMADYRYRGISALNAWQGDRAIEQIASYQQRLRRLMSERGIDPTWVTAWNGWLREVGATEADRILAWARLGRKGGDTAEYTRQLRPRVVDNVPHWLWTTAKPADSLVNFWLALDSKTFPAQTRADLSFEEDASRPISADDLLSTARRLLDEDMLLTELGRDIGRPFQQGAAAIAAGFLNAEADRRAIQIAGFRVLQFTHPIEPARPTGHLERRGIARPCPVCARPPSMHKCCPTCAASATGEAEIERLFGFRRMTRSNGVPYEIPQTWCRACRTLARATDPNKDLLE